MVCQYSRPSPVSSEKHEPVLEPGVQAEASGVVAVTAVDGYGARPESLIASTRRAKPATALRFRTCGRLSLYDTLLERLAQHFEDMPAELRQRIQK
jgi:hypothetical protein